MKIEYRRVQGEGRRGESAPSRLRGSAHPRHEKSPGFNLLAGPRSLDHKYPQNGLSPTNITIIGSKTRARISYRFRLGRGWGFVDSLARTKDNVCCTLTSQLPLPYRQTNALIHYMVHLGTNRGRRYSSMVENHRGLQSSAAILRDGRLDRCWSGLDFWPLPPIGDDQ